jgi:membrane protein
VRRRRRNDVRQAQKSQFGPTVSRWLGFRVTSGFGRCRTGDGISEPADEGLSHRQTEAEGVETIAAMEPDRGREAETLSAIPARGWKDVILRLYNDLSEHRILALAAGRTYYALLAIFPAIAALVAIYGLFSDPSSIANHLD